ncbi:hypothetical protein MKC62_22985, partial [[Clostridium] innocuum]|nr:hypothetical protein [[Clostridium] innocuum]
DIVDEYTSMKKREEVFSLLEGLCTKSDVFYVFGNHDTGQYSLGQFTRNYTQTTKRGLLTTNKG